MEEINALYLGASDIKGIADLENLKVQPLVLIDSVENFEKISTPKGYVTLYDMIYDIPESLMVMVKEPNEKDIITQIISANGEEIHDVVSITNEPNNAVYSLLNGSTVSTYDYKDEILTELGITEKGKTK